MKLKAKLVVVNKFDEEEYRDFYLDVSKIQAWYVPNSDENLGEMLNIYLSGECFSIAQEPHILEFLMKEFVEPSKLLSKEMKKK